MEKPGGTGGATWQGNGVASNVVIARLALQPRVIQHQNRSRPTPYGETTPMPLIAPRLANRHSIHQSPTVRRDPADRPAPSINITPAPELSLPGCCFVERPRLWRSGAP